MCDHGITHLCLDVNNVEAEYEPLRDAGMRFHCEPQDLGFGVNTTYGRDPDGNVVELQELTPAGEGPHPYGMAQHTLPGVSHAVPRPSRSGLGSDRRLLGGRGEVGDRLR